MKNTVTHLLDPYTLFVSQVFMGVFDSTCTNVHLNLYCFPRYPIFCSISRSVLFNGYYLCTSTFLRNFPCCQLKTVYDSLMFLVCFTAHEPNHTGFSIHTYGSQIMPRQTQNCHQKLVWQQQYKCFDFLSKV